MNNILELLMKYMNGNGKMDNNINPSDFFSNANKSTFNPNDILSNIAGFGGNNQISQLMSLFNNTNKKNGTDISTNTKKNKSSFSTKNYVKVKDYYTKK